MARIKPLPIRQSLTLAVLALEAEAERVRPAHGGHTSVQCELLGAVKTIKGAMRANETSQPQSQRVPTACRGPYKRR